VPFYKLSDVIHASVAVASISITSKAEPLVIALQTSHTPQGCSVGLSPSAIEGLRQNLEVLPVPLGPVGAIFDVRIAFVRVWRSPPDRPDGKFWGDIYSSGLCINRPQYSLGMQPFRPGGGKDGFGDRFILTDSPIPRSLRSCYH